MIHKPGKIKSEFLILFMLVTSGAMHTLHAHPHEHEVFILEGTGKKARVIQKDIAGKTGTTDNYKDALFIGFNPGVSVGVWVGNDDSTSLGRYETGAKAALPIWIDYMRHYLSTKPYQYFDIPDGTKMVSINLGTGNTSKTSQAVKALIKTKDLQ